MADEKVVVGWAVRGASGTSWLGKPSINYPNLNWQGKDKRHIFPTLDAARQEFYTNGMARDREAAVVRITRKVKPKQYFVVAGPFSIKANAEYTLRCHACSPLFTVVEKDPSK